MNTKSAGHDRLTEEGFNEISRERERDGQHEPEAEGQSQNQQTLGLSRWLNEQAARNPKSRQAAAAAAAVRSKKGAHKHSTKENKT